MRRKKHFAGLLSLIVGASAVLSVFAPLTAAEEPQLSDSVYSEESISDMVVSNDPIYNKPDEHFEAHVLPEPDDITMTEESAEENYMEEPPLYLSAPVLPSHKVVELGSDIIKYSSYYSQYAQTYSEACGGLFFLVDNDLIFYSLSDFTSKKIYSFPGCTSAYFANEKLYVVDSKICYIYDLVNGGFPKKFSMNSYYGVAIGADAQGRIYVSARDDEYNYYILLYSNNGSLLNSLEVENTVYSFNGFDPKTGNFFMEASSNWRYWGYDHYGRAAIMGNVTNNTLKLINVSNDVNMGGLTVYVEGFDYLFQNYYTQRQNCVGYLGNKYLMTMSLTFGRKLIIDIDEMALCSSMSLGYAALDDEAQSEFQNGTYGIMAVYNEQNHTIISAEIGNTIIEFSPESQEVISSFTPAHPVFSLMNAGNSVLAIEKENDVFYLEIIKWANPSKLTVSVDSTNMIAGTTQKVRITADSALNQNYYYSSSDTTVATVSDEGVIAAWGEGSAAITCRTMKGSAAGTVKINVTARSSPSFSPMTTLDGAESKNLSANNYSTYGSPVKSYLFENSDGTFSRVENIGNSVIIEKYSKTNSLIGSKNISCELPIFGGAFSGKNYNFLVFGKKNENDSETEEVMRVVKYTKAWSRLGAYSAVGANTYIPFDAGSLRMDEAGEHLYVYTCHEMFLSSDGYHHQANMTFVLNQTTMTEEQSYYDVMNNSYGYVSHSFNQFVKTDGKYVYRVDHGDAHPRGIYISMCEVGEDITGVTSWAPFSFKSFGNYNYTGASLGGFELSGDRCVIAGNSIDQSDESTASYYSQRNIFILSIKKDMSDKSVTWLTNYKDDDSGNASVEVRTPHLVKLSDEHFLVMWEEKNKQTELECVKFACIDSKGNIVSLKSSDNYFLSDCKPVLTSYGTVKWYVSNGLTYMFEYDPFESDPVPAFVERLYQNILGRGSDPAGKAKHVLHLRNGETACKVAYDFVFSSEFLKMPISNSERVRRMYLTFLDREPDTTGLANWTQMLDNGCSVGRLFYGFTRSDEFTGICDKYGIARGSWEITENRDRSPQLTAFVSRLYTKAMGRSYDVKGLNNHTGRYLQNKDMYSLAYSFIFSQEYLNKNLSDEEFVENMYETFFDRHSDAAGKAGWLAKMKNGMTRKEVLAGFVNSQECKNLIAKFGL